MMIHPSIFHLLVVEEKKTLSSTIHSFLERNIILTHKMTNNKVEPCRTFERYKKAALEKCQRRERRHLLSVFVAFQSLPPEEAQRVLQEVQSNTPEEFVAVIDKYKPDGAKGYAPRDVAD